MLVNLFNTVKGYGVPVTLREFLDLLTALDKKLIFADWNDFYYLSRTMLVKDEKNFDKFDRAFDVYFKGIENMDDLIKMIIPEDWIRKQFEKELTPEEKILQLEDKLARTFAEMENQRRRFEKEKEDAFEYGGFSFAREKRLTL